MRRFDPGPRLQSFQRFTNKFNSLGAISGSLWIGLDRLKSVSNGIDVGPESDWDSIDPIPGLS